MKWKEEVKEAGCVEGISKANSDLTLRYVFDMEVGINVSAKSVKGARSYIRLNNLKQRMIFLSKRFEEYYSIESLTDLTEIQVVTYFAKIRSGEIRKMDGGVYKSVIDFIQIFKSFWHWYMKVSKKQGIKILDITEELDCSKEKPDWVYLNEAQVRKMCDKGKHKYKVFIMFLFDTGIRAPTELMNIKVSDFYEDFKELNIRTEVAKKGSFGRKIKLMLCSELVKDFIKEKGLKNDDFVFQICPTVVNRYLKRLAKRLFGEEKTLAGQKYSDLTMYDFRHCSCCYWLPRYKSESALKFRFGWKKSDKIHYYSEMLGMRDTISEDDMLVDVTKTELENRLLKTEKDYEILKEELDAIRKQSEIMKRLVGENFGNMGRLANVIGNEKIFVVGE
ncbi:site-specific integrase [Candidatus Pacearchaeota archaeon]|nr:site-specific integrase [Candidatus Pacearchaeota archaeon]